MQIYVECDDPNKSSATLCWLLMKYHWTHAVCLTDFSRSQLLCPKTFATFPLSGDFKSHARQPRNGSSVTDVHFWTWKYMGRKTNFAVWFSPFISQISFLWFLKFVNLNVYSIAWIPAVWGDLRLSVGAFSQTPASNWAASENRSKESSN